MSTVWNYIQHKLGEPAELRALLKKHPDFAVTLEQPPQSIAASSVVKWHEWGQPYSGHRFGAGEITGWCYSEGRYSGYRVKRKEFIEFGSCERIETWQCDIQDVVGLSASKSPLQDFESLDRMVETRSREMIEPITREKLSENLAWGEIRILNRKNSSDYFTRYSWDGRVFLMNDGGSHHFSAARYISSRLNVPVPLSGQLRIYSINENAVISLKRDFEMFVVGWTDAISMAFLEAMKSFCAAYLWQYLPPPYQAQEQRVILLPKSDSRSMKVASVLHQAGFFDLSKHLDKLIDRQVELSNI